MRVDVKNLEDLLNEGKLVELGELIKKGSKNENVVKFLNRKYEDFKKTAERFTELSPDERLKMAFILAAKTTIVENMKTTQIRKILSMSNMIYRKIKRRQEDISADIAKIRYVLAYTASRHKSRREDPITPILEVSDKILPKLDSNNYEDFHEFLQAIVAYHKFLGGRD